MHPSAAALTLTAAFALLAACARATRGTAPGPGQAARPIGGTAALEDLADGIGRGRYGAVDSLVVRIGDKIVLERYWNGYGPDDLHDCYSVTKSVVALAYAAAAAEGMMPGPEAPLEDLLPECAPLFVDGKERLRLGHVLEMSAGFAWDEFAVPYDDPRNPVRSIMAAGEPARALLELPLATEPGLAFRYNSGLSNLLGRLVERGVGEGIESWTARKLFRPLGIGSWEWDRFPNGDAGCGWGLSLRPRDILALAVLLRDRGSFAGTRVLAEDAVDALLETRMKASERAGYARQFWTLRWPEKERLALGLAEGAAYPLAVGWGGQYAIALRELDAAVASTASDYGAETEGILKCVDELAAAIAEARAAME